MATLRYDDVSSVADDKGGWGGSGILRQSFLKVGDHHGPEFGRLDDLYAGAVTEQFLHQVGRKAEPVSEYRVAVVDDFALRMVQRQCPQILGLARVGLDAHRLSLSVGEYDAVRVT